MGLSSRTTPELHDKEMAYSTSFNPYDGQSFFKMDVPEIHQKQNLSAIKRNGQEMIRYDSDELFLAIQRDNPYTKQKARNF